MTQQDWHAHIDRWHAAGVRQVRLASEVFDGLCAAQGCHADALDFWSPWRGYRITISRRGVDHPSALTVEYQNTFPALAKRMAEL